VGEKTPAFDDDNWELYDTNKDWTQANNLAEQMPEKLHELQRLWLIEATRYNVLPLDDRAAERINAEMAGRRELIKGKSQILFGSMGRLSENMVLNLKNKSHSVTAEIVVPASGAEGVIVAQGGNIGGWSLTQRAASSNTVTTCSAYSASTPNRLACCLQVSTRCAWSLLTLGAGLGKGGTARCPCMWNAKRSEGAISALQRPLSSLPMMVATSEWTRDPLFRWTMAHAETNSTESLRGFSWPLPRML
jgi:hypothetical protein